jgi:phage shock protein E
MRSGLLRPARPARPVVLGAALTIAAAVLAGCGGHGGGHSEHGATPAAAAAPQAEAAADAGTAQVQGAVEQLKPAAFAQRLKSTEGMVLNVHVPDEGEIPGTDAHIPYSGVATSAKLPADKATELLVYCRSGSMSAEAAQSLLAAGYTRVIELAGGFQAWKAAGRTFTAGPA